MKLDKNSLMWLREKGFERDEISFLESKIELLKSGNLPSAPNLRTQLLLEALSLHPPSETTIITEDVKRTFEENSEISQLEQEFDLKVKLGRTHSKAKRRSSVKKERY